MSQEQEWTRQGYSHLVLQWWQTQNYIHSPTVNLNYKLQVGKLEPIYNVDSIKNF